MLASEARGVTLEIHTNLEGRRDERGSTRIPRRRELVEL